MEFVNSCAWSCPSPGPGSGDLRRHPNHCNLFGNLALSRALCPKLTPASTLQGPVEQMEWQGQAGPVGETRGHLSWVTLTPWLLSPRRRGEASANVIKRERQEKRPLSPPGPPHAHSVLLSGLVEAVASFHIPLIFTAAIEFPITKFTIHSANMKF